MLFSKKWLRSHPQFLLHFLIHIDAIESLSQFQQEISELWPSIEMGQFLKIQCTIAQELMWRIFHSSPVIIHIYTTQFHHYYVTFLFLVINRKGKD